MNLGESFYKLRVPFAMLFVIAGLVSAYFDPFIIKTKYNLLLGFVVGLMAVILRIWASSFTWENIDSISPQAESGLITAGPYAFVRHPIYLGGTLLVLALNVGLGSPLAIFTMLIPTVLTHIWQASYEEKYLAFQIGEKFQRYKKKIPLLFPRLGVKYDRLGGCFNLKKGIKHDLGPLSAFTIFCVILTIYTRSSILDVLSVSMILGISIMLALGAVILGQRCIK